MEEPKQTESTAVQNNKPKPDANVNKHITSDVPATKPTKHTNREIAGKEWQHSTTGLVKPFQGH